MGLETGALSGYLASKKTGGTDTGNAFNLSGAEQEAAKNAGMNVLNYKGSNDALDPIQSSKTATSEVQNNGILGQLYGQGGTLDRTNAEEQNLATKGYSLQPEDYEAYGQGSGQIARDFGGAEQGLSEALSAQGLSNSGVAGRAFMTSQGNKLEQLGGLQRKIANDRMNMNMQRLGQTRSFLTAMSQQGAGAINDQYGRQTGSEKARFGETLSQGQMGQQMLGNMQQQANENLKQRSQTEGSPAWAQAGQGAIQANESDKKSAAAAAPALASMMSDRRVKENIKPADNDLYEFLDALTGYTYNYKPDYYSGSESTSVMAQDLEKTRIGKQMVINTLEGKKVDYTRAVAAMLAAQVHLHNRLKAVEGK